MSVIHKYQLPIIGGRLALNLPYLHSVVHVAWQYGQPTFWVRKTHSNPPEFELWDFYWVGTGHEFPDTAICHGSLLDIRDDGMTYVWHLIAERRHGS